MSGFSPYWLSLREPVDHVSRSLKLRSALLQHLHARHGKSLTGLRILDLGAGSGSNLRALAPYLGYDQNWCLVDHDISLLHLARELLLKWADDIERDDSSGIRIQHGSTTMDVSFQQVDLAQGLEDLLLVSAYDLVTSSALFDLVSADWIARFVSALQTDFYAVLNYDGICGWQPKHELDEVILRAFNMHQRTDKGFGPACGPDATEELRRLLVQRGFSVSTGGSPWQLDRGETALMHLLNQGVVQAAIETGVVSLQQGNEWLAFREQTQKCWIGHIDLLATYPL